MKAPKLTAIDVELAIADHFGYRVNQIVPNIGWGLFGNREVDIFIVRPSGWGDEVEIKVSASDIRADLHKRHGHIHPLISRTWFAVPRGIATADIPEHFGILEVWQTTDHGLQTWVKEIRVPKRDKFARKLSEAQIAQVCRLATMRIWTLKKHLHYQLEQRRYREGNETTKRAGV